MTSYKIICSHCGNRQEYKPVNKIPKDPHTNCKGCGKDFHFNNPNNKIITIEQKSKNGKSKQQRSKKWQDYQVK